MQRARPRHDAEPPPEKQRSGKSWGTRWCWSSQRFTDMYCGMCLVLQETLNQYCCSCAAHINLQYLHLSIFLIIIFTNNPQQTLEKRKSWTQQFCGSLMRADIIELLWFY